MKKIMSLFCLLLIGFVLSGCTKEKLTIEFVDEFNQVKQEAVKFKTDQTLLEILEANFKVKKLVSAYGTMIEAIDILEPKEGSYIAIYKNNQPLVVGVDDVTFSKGDVISFRIEFWNPLPHIEALIELFVTEHADKYLTIEPLDSLNPWVVMALARLNRLEDFLTLEQATSAVKHLTTDNIGQLFKAITLIEALGGNAFDVEENNLVDQLITHLPDGLFTTPYALMALNLIQDERVNDAKATLVQQILTKYQPSTDDIDMASDLLVALAPYYATNAAVKAMVDNFITAASKVQTEAGGMINIWTGEVENGATTAKMIIGLTAVGHSPVSELFTTASYQTLISHLLKYVTADGTFKNLLTDQTTDTGFTTPQAMVALITYHLLSNQMPANLFVPIE